MAPVRWNMRYYPFEVWNKDNAPKELIDVYVQFRSDKCIVCNELGVMPAVTIVGEDVSHSGKYSFVVFVCTTCVEVVSHDAVAQLVNVLAQAIVNEAEEE